MIQVVVLLLIATWETQSLNSESGYQFQHMIVAYVYAPGTAALGVLASVMCWANPTLNKAIPLVHLVGALVLLALVLGLGDTDRATVSYLVIAASALGVAVSASLLIGTFQNKSFV